MAITATAIGLITAMAIDAHIMATATGHTVITATAGDQARLGLALLRTTPRMMVLGRQKVESPDDGYQGFFRSSKRREEVGQGNHHRHLELTQKVTAVDIGADKGQGGDQVRQFWTAPARAQGSHQAAGRVLARSRRRGGAHLCRRLQRSCGRGRALSTLSWIGAWTDVDGEANAVNDEQRAVGQRRS